MLFCGIDLCSNNCFVVISDDGDRVLYSRRLPNSLDQICAALNPYRTNLFGVVVESTYNWYWLVNGLIDAGYPLQLAKTTAIKQYDRVAAFAIRWKVNQWERGNSASKSTLSSDGVM